MQAAIAEMMPQNSHSSWKNAAVVNAAAPPYFGHQGAGDIHGQDSVNPAVLLFAAKKLKSNMDILHSFSPFFTPQDWFDAPYFMICNKTAKSVAQCAKKTEKDLCGIFLTIVIYYLQ